MAPHRISAFEAIHRDKTLSTVLRLRAALLVESLHVPVDSFAWIWYQNGAKFLLEHAERVFSGKNNYL